MWLHLTTRSSWQKPRASSKPTERKWLRFSSKPLGSRACTLRSSLCSCSTPSGSRTAWFAILERVWLRLSQSTMVWSWRMGPRRIPLLAVLWLNICKGYCLRRAWQLIFQLSMTWNRNIALYHRMWRLIKVRLNRAKSLFRNTNFLTVKWFLLMHRDSWHRKHSLSHVSSINSM